MKVAVYGTLKKQRGNHILLADATYIKTMFLPQFALYVDGLPFVKKTGNPKHKTLIEIYDINEQILARLDQLEGHPTFYKRTKETYQKHSFWIYQYTGHLENQHYQEAGVY